MNKAIVAVVPSRIEAENIVRELNTFISPSDISVLFPDSHGTKDFAHEHNTKAPEGAATGAAAGGLLGGTIGVLAGIGALAIPGLGPFIAAGPLMAALSGAAAGAGVGGLTGALIGMGIPEYEAKLYEGKLRSGGLLVSVHTDDSAQRERVEQVFKQNGASDVSTVNETSVPKDARL